MNTKTLLTLSFIFILLNLKAQDSIRYKNTIKFIPTKFLNYHPGIEIEFEHFIKWNISLQTSFAYCFPNGINSEDKNGIRTQFEGKFYFDIREKKIKRHMFYFATNIMYSRFNSQYFAKEYYSFQGMDDFYYKKVEVSTIKDAYSLNFKVGYVYQYKRLAFEYYLGNGLKYLNIKADRTLPNIIQDEVYIITNPGTYWLPNFLGGLKIGYNF